MSSIFTSISISVKYEPILYLYKSYNTVIQMLNDRGHEVSNHEMKDIQQFIEAFDLDPEKPDFHELRQSMQISSIFEGKNHIVVWIGSLSFSIRDVGRLRLLMDNSDAKDAIIICYNQPKSQSKDAIKDLKRLGFNIEIFSESEMQYNVTHHEKVPKHELITDEEVSKIMEQYGITLQQFPRIRNTEKVARYFGARTGQVFKITRPCEIWTTDGTERMTSITYRVVVKE